ncbi:MAG: SDR family NAD(P)-dependent oxidoreductase [Chloroflexota bacterium]|nr:SDR family NAD(P)-dependent oxidoreductase [Chloroflexota bacterium]
MEQQVALVVGGTKGIGKEVVRQLARKGYHVLFVGRSEEAGKALEAELNQRGSATFIQGDMSLLAETHRVALRIREMTPTLNILIHSADILAMDRIETAEGHEMAFAINYLSRFLMNDLLMDHLKAGQARILHIAAAGSPFTLNASSFPPGPKVNSMTGHGIGQGANDVYGIEMAERLRDTGVTINILNPGGVDTDIRRNMKLHGLQKMIMPVMMMVMKVVFRMKLTQPEEYARVPVDYATNPRHKGLTGQWIKWDGTLFEIKPERYPQSMRDHVWRETERLVAEYRALPEPAFA